MTAPYRIEYRGPEGWTVWNDEDGVHIRTPKGDGLESPDVTRLIALIEEARQYFESGSVPTPAPPSPEDARAMWCADREEHAAKRAARTVYKALAPDPTPF